MAVRPAEPGSGSVSSVADVEDQNAGAGDLALDLAVPLLGQLQPARDRLGGPPHLDPVRADREVQAIIPPPLAGAGPQQPAVEVQLEALVVRRGSGDDKTGVDF